jgi:hypothetical protein
MSERGQTVSAVLMARAAAEYRETLRDFRRHADSATLVRANERFADRPKPASRRPARAA